MWHGHLRKELGTKFAQKLTLEQVGKKTLRTKMECTLYFRDQYEVLTFFFLFLFTFKVRIEWRVLFVCLWSGGDSTGFSTLPCDAWHDCSNTHFSGSSNGRRKCKSWQWDRNKSEKEKKKKINLVLDIVLFCAFMNQFDRNCLHLWWFIRKRKQKWFRLYCSWLV